MPGKNKTPLIGWHSADPTLKPWLEAEAERRGVTLREFLDEVLAKYRMVTLATPGTCDRPGELRKSIEGVQQWLEQ